MFRIVVFRPLTVVKCFVFIISGVVSVVSVVSVFRKVFKYVTHSKTMKMDEPGIAPGLCGFKSHALLLSNSPIGLFFLFLK